MSSGASAPESATPLVARVVPLIPAWRVDREFDYLVPDDLAGKVAAGSLVRARFGARRMRGIVTGLDRRVPDRDLEPLAGVVIDVPLAPDGVRRVLEWVALRYVAPRGAVYGRVVPPRVRVKVTAVGPPEPGPDPLVLGTYERGTELVAALRAGTGGAWCVQARPGEDRGRLIGELVGAALAAGRGAALVAVPEVGYGPPVIARLTAMFPSAARIDAGVPDADRARAWISMALGSRLAVGGRAAVLAPAERLALVVIDDEFEPSFKDDRAPRIDARRIALERARLQAAACVLVSASPAVETGAAALSAEMGSVRPTRAGERGARPIVEIVDPPTARVLSPEVHRAIKDTLAGGRRAAVLTPRRGYARSLWCGSCRRSMRCPQCEAGLGYERSRDAVRCPRCRYSAPAPASCPHCGAREFRHLGAGSERLAEQLEASFPRARVVRADPDVLEGATQSDLDAFGDADLYVTTWIGTKPAFRPDVSTVCMLDVDGLIRRPDFRAAERAYQAIVEMVGWAGPASEGGRLVLQTAEASHYVIQAAARGDYGYFLERELEARRELGYPPFSELVRIDAAGPNARALLGSCAGAARSAGARVLGPAEVRRGAEKRLEILIKCADATALAPGLRRIASGAGRGDRLRIDVDPR